MPNSFNKEERVAFEQILEGFQDALVMSRNVSIYKTDQTMMERTNNTIWRPQPYIARSFSGTDMTGNFSDYIQLAVPATIGFNRSVPWSMSATELRDALQEQRLGDAAKQKLASDINVSVLGVATSQGTLVVKRQSAASGFDDVAECEAVFNEQGVNDFDRFLALSTRDYNGMASNLASRQTLSGKALTAYDRAYIGQIASFNTYKLDYSNRIQAAAGVGITIDTRDSANNYWVPKSVTTSPTTSERLNVDNRFQTVTVSSTTGVAAGDAFTIAAVNSVHHITKNDTGRLKTYRVISVTNSTQMVISPPIISNQVSSAASAEYQNCVVNTKASNSAIVFLNTAAAQINCFWQKDAIEILPGRYAIPSGAGADVIRASTDQGIELVMQKQYNLKTMMTDYRLDTIYGVVNKQPQMSGIILFNQP